MYGPLAGQGYDDRLQKITREPYGVARSMIPEAKMTPINWPDAMPFSRGGGGGSMSFGGGRPQQLDTTRGDYGLPTIWSPEATIKESTDWAHKIATSQPGNGLTQFDINTFSDPMAKRQGRGVYYMNPNETYASSPGHFRGAR